MTRNTFKGEEPEEEKPFDKLIEEATMRGISIDEVPNVEEVEQTRKDRELTRLRLLAEHGSVTAQHQLDLLMRDQEG